MTLDNAAKIYPAAMSKGWTALFRLSANLNDPIDADLLQKALDRTLPRFPSFSQRLKRGLFWFYLEPISQNLMIQRDVANPCVRMNLKENDGFMFRVRYHENRIAVEFFHVLTDGSGGLVFLKTLVAEYIELRYGETVPRDQSILDCREKADPGELEDSFLKHSGALTRSRKESASYLIPGTEEKHYMNIITGLADVDKVLEVSKKYRATLTEFLVAALILSIEKIQLHHKPIRRHHKPVKICVPINLRKYYATKTLRNFSSYINPGIEPKYGDFSLEETIKIVHGHMSQELNEKLLNAKFTTNVKSEKNYALRLVPLFLKNPFLKLAFLHKGDKLSSSTVSNLGSVVLPESMQNHVNRLDFMLGPLKRNRVTCACISYNNVLAVNFTRKIREPDVERIFFTQLVKLGIKTTIESNQRSS